MLSSSQVQNHMEAENVKKIHKELMRISAMLQVCF